MRMLVKNIFFVNTDVGPEQVTVFPPAVHVPIHDVILILLPFGHVSEQLVEEVVVVPPCRFFISKLLITQS